MAFECSADVLRTAGVSCLLSTLDEPAPVPLPLPIPLPQVDRKEPVVDESSRREPAVEGNGQPVAAVPPELFLDNSPYYIAYIDADCRYGFLNRRYEVLLGMDPERAVGRHVREILGEGPFSDLLPYVKRALAGESTTYQRWVTLPELGDRYLNTIYLPHLEEERVLGFFAYGIDITEQRRLEEARMEFELNYRAVFETKAVGIARMGPNGEWLEVNDRLCEILGYERKELLKLGLQQLTHPDDLEKDLRLSEQLFRGELDRYDLEKRYVRKDGTILWGSLSASCVRGEDGEALFAVGVLRDISARKSAEQEVRNLNQTLEQRIEQRTAELASLNEELDAFNYSVSHDLRAPLRGIGGFARLLEEEHGKTLDEQGRRYLDRVQSGVHRLGQLLDSLLTLSRMTRADLSSKDVDVSAIARETVQAVQADGPGRNVDFVVADGMRACADESMLRILLRTLLDNAWKFTRYAERARIVIASRDEAGERVFYVEDNGAGFDERYAEKLFTPFQRLHSPNQFEGQGVGLATAQRIVHRHGGRIWARGAVGEGATFYFTLPPEQPAR